MTPLSGSMRCRRNSRGCKGAGTSHTPGLPPRTAANPDRFRMRRGRECGRCCRGRGSSRRCASACSGRTAAPAPPHCAARDGRGREQVLAGAAGRLVAGGAVRKLGQGDLVELSAAVGVGEVRDAVRAHAVGEGECLLGRRRLRAGRPSRIRSAARTAGGWAGAARRGQQDQGGRGDDSGSGSHPRQPWPASDADKGVQHGSRPRVLLGPMGAFYAAAHNRSPTGWGSPNASQGRKSWSEGRRRLYPTHEARRPAFRWWRGARAIARRRPFGRCRGSEDRHDNDRMA